MKKIISVLLCVCMLSGVFGVFAFAQDAETEALERIDITVTQNEVYCDLPAYNCIFRRDTTPEDLYTYAWLQKNIDGEWQSVGQMSR